MTRSPSSRAVQVMHATTGKPAPCRTRSARRGLLRIVALTVAWSLAGCDALQGERGGGSPVDAASQHAADLARGEILSYACRACHGFTPADESPIGPPLAGMFGRSAAAVEGFDYSRAMRESGIVWTPEALDAWLARPNDFLPGNNMAFAGFRSAADRRALIAYLKVTTEREAP